MKVWKIVVMGVATLAVSILYYFTMKFGHFDQESLVFDHIIVLLACAGLWVVIYLAINPPWRKR